MKRDVQALYQLWRKNAGQDPALQNELEQIAGRDEEILDRFYQDLAFGTAGLRGILGAGTNRMNLYTVNQATQGLANYLLQKFTQPSVVIGYDSRINSILFAENAAGVLAANGIQVSLFQELVPTPLVSFAVRQLSCQSGIVITASHNPAAYNGYKCYDPQGYQMTETAAQATQDCIREVDIFSGVKQIEFSAGLAAGKIQYVQQALLDEFYARILECQANPGICQGSGLRVVYTPLNGAGNRPVRGILERIGLDDVQVVPSQEQSDGNFPTCPYPNPESREAFQEAIALAQQQVEKPDLLLATDPDCDRVGIAVYDQGEYVLCTGNEVGALLTEYLLASRKAAGMLPEQPLILKSIVTTKWIDVIAAQYGAQTVGLLTGFKYMGEYISTLERKGEESRFVLAMEESYGYLAGTHARDKDAVVGSMLIGEMAAYYKKQGKNLREVLRDMAIRYGVFVNQVANLQFPGAQGMQEMQRIMYDLRETPPEQIAGFPVVLCADYQRQQVENKQTGVVKPTGLPASNVLYWELPQGDCVFIRPSGTEPKIKVYATACTTAKTLQEYPAAMQQAGAFADALVQAIQTLAGLT